MTERGGAMPPFLFGRLYAVEEGLLEKDDL
jgi:hypothetical protein